MHRDAHVKITPAAAAEAGQTLAAQAQFGERLPAGILTRAGPSSVGTVGSAPGTASGIETDCSRHKSAPWRSKRGSGRLRTITCGSPSTPPGGGLGWPLPGMRSASPSSAPPAVAIDGPYARRDFPMRRDTDMGHRPGHSRDLQPQRRYRVTARVDQNAAQSASASARSVNAIGTAPARHMAFSAASPSPGFKSTARTASASKTTS